MAAWPQHQLRASSHPTVQGSQPPGIPAQWISVPDIYPEVDDAARGSVLEQISGRVPLDNGGQVGGVPEQVTDAAVAVTAHDRQQALTSMGRQRTLTSWIRAMHTQSSRSSWRKREASLSGSWD